jgi:hypothetical protein
VSTPATAAGGVGAGALAADLPPPHPHSEPPASNTKSAHVSVFMSRSPRGRFDRTAPTAFFIRNAGWWLATAAGVSERDGIAQTASRRAVDRFSRMVCGNRDERRDHFYRAFSRPPERRHRRSGGLPDRDAPTRQPYGRVRITVSASPQIAPGSAAPFGVPSPVHASQPFAASKSPLLPLMMSRSACGLPYSIGFKYPAGAPLV